MSEQGFGWLPPLAAARIADEEAHELAEAKRAEAKRADLADQAHDRAVTAYRAAAEQRGEVVSAVALARGEVAGRTVADVFADAAAAADREDARSASRERRDTGFIDQEPVIHGTVVGRSAWPSSERELDRMLRRADELHRDLVVIRAKRDYPGAIEAARTKAAATPMISW